MSPPADAARITKRLQRKKMLSSMPPSGGFAKKEKENGRPLQGLPVLRYRGEGVSESILCTSVPVDASDIPSPHSRKPAVRAAVKIDGCN